MGSEMCIRDRQLSSESVARGPVDVYLCIQTPELTGWAQGVAMQLREALPLLRLRVHGGGGKLDKQLKRANACGARVALIAGTAERAAEGLQFKPLRSGEPGVVLTVAAVIERLKQDVFSA